MNKVAITAICFCLFSMQASAQIPNAGFEDWTTVVNRMSPAGWHSINDFIDSSATYFPVTRSTDHYPDAIGSYSIRIESNSTFSAPYSWGMAMTCLLDSASRPLFPITGHPDTLYGYYKYLPQNDTMYIHVHLFKNGIDVATGELLSGETVSAWTLFKIPIPTYTDADSARISLCSFYEGKNKSMTVYGNSVLFVDNLSFNAPPAGVRNIQATATPFDVTISGNNILSYTLPKETPVSIKVFDTRGRLIAAIVDKKQAAGRYSLPLLQRRSFLGAYILCFNAGDRKIRKCFVAAR